MTLKQLPMINALKCSRWRRPIWVTVVLAATTLACVTNTPVAQVSTPRPTRTPLPTFTNTPIPPTPTITPTFTNTPVPTDTPVPTNTPLPPTDTPIPTDTPLPTQPPPPPPTQPPPPPPTNTPVPAPTAAPANTSPVATPTNTPEPGTPPGRYEIDSEQNKEDCANIGIFGKVREKGSDRPVQFVTIEVKGDDDDFKGPYTDKTDANGRYDIFITGTDNDDVDGVEFKAKVVGDGVESEDTAEWIVSTDCEEDDATQVYEINWNKK